MKLQWQKSNAASATPLLQGTFILLLTLAFSLSLSQLLAEIFYFSPVPWAQGFILAVCMLLILELSFRFYRVSVPLILFALLSGVLFLSLDEATGLKIVSVWINFRDTALGEANQAWLSSGSRAFTENNQETLYLLTVGLLTVTSFFIVRLFRQASVMLILLVICSAQAEFQQINNLLIPVGIALFCTIFLLGLSVRGGNKKFQLPVIRVIVFLLIALLLQAALAPAVLYNADLDRLLRKTEDRFSTGEKTSGFYEFSLGSAGYYPESSELGGPIRLSDSPFAEITAGPSAMYLRGLVYGEYTGKSWIAEGMSGGLRFDDVSLAELREKTFALTPPAAVRDELLKAGSYHVKPVHQPQQSILLGGVPQEIEFPLADLSVGLYFNASGSISADRNIPNEGYQVNGAIIDISNPGYENSLNLLLSLPAPLSSARMSEEERQFWLTLPDAVSSQLLADFFLTTETAVGAPQNTNLSTALQIKERLSSDLFTYALEVPEVPKEREFVQWFLEEKSGYCTYFATALTVLCRQAGIPARYVEGYILPELTAELDGQYRRTISGRQAHAWTEVWVDEVGWLILDATPSDYRNSLLAPALEEAESGTELTTPLATESSATTSPTQETAGTTAPNQSDNSVTTVRNQTETADKRSTITFKNFLPYIAGFLLIYALIAYYLWRVEVLKRKHDDTYLIKQHHGNRSALVLAIWKDMRYLARLQNLKQAKGQTLRQYLDSWPAEFQLKHTSVIVNQAIYGSNDISEVSLQLLMDDYEKFEFKVKNRMNPLTWVLRRFLNPWR